MKQAMTTPQKIFRQLLKISTFALSLMLVFAFFVFIAGYTEGIFRAAFGMSLFLTVCSTIYWLPKMWCAHSENVDKFWRQEESADALTSTDVLTENAMLNALNGEAALNGIDDVVIQEHDQEIRNIIRKLIVASRDK